MKKEEIKAISFESRILDISLINFKVFHKKNVKVNKNDFAFEFNIKIKLSPSIKSIEIDSSINIFSDQTKDLLLADIASVGKFEILNYEEIIKEYKGMPNPIISVFIGVLISTTRGFLILKSKDTLIDGALIPLSNPNSFFANKEGVIKEKENE
jgi:hypothetical protein